MEFSPSATEQEADTAMKYDLIIPVVERGVDLFAFALLMATFKDWLAICQAKVPFHYERNRISFLCITRTRQRMVWIHLHPRNKHARGNKQIGEDITRHAEW